MLGIAKPIYQIRSGDSGYYLHDAPSGFIEKKFYDKLIKDLKYSELTQDTTLYFSKSSTFPRLKLENTGFKRCIKLDKADFVIINPSSLTNNCTSFHVIETDTVIYLVYYGDLYYKRDKLETFLGFKIKDYGMMNFYEMTEKRKDLFDLIHQPNVKLVHDDALNKMINKSDEILDKDSMINIYSMLKSSDLDTVELGLKMLTGFNVDKTPLTISAMLLSTNRWWFTNAKTNVLVQNMLKQLDIYGKRSGTHFPYNIKCLYTYEKTASEYDKELAKSLLFDKIVEHFSRLCTGDIEFFKMFNVNIKIDIS